MGDFRGGGGHRGGHSGPRQMFDAVCSDCGQACQVPFSPIQGKPVYCQACFANHRPQRG